MSSPARRRRTSNPGAATPDGVAFIKPKHLVVETLFTALFATLAVCGFAWMVSTQVRNSYAFVSTLDVTTPYGAGTAAGLAMGVGALAYLMFYPEGQRASES